MDSGCVYVTSFVHDVDEMGLDKECFRCKMELII